MNAVTHITACRLCDSRDLDLVVSFTPTPPGDQYVTADKWQEAQACYPLDVLVCRGCGAVQLADTVDPKLIYPEYLYTTSVSKGLHEHFEKYAVDVLAHLQPKTGAMAVDIGSNDGTLLQQFRQYGCRVLGVEPAEKIAAQAIAHGIPTHHAFFSEACARELVRFHGQADLITANHVMANVADLHDFAHGIKALLAPDGTFVFETGYWPAIMDGNLIDTIEHEHIHYFAVAPLIAFFARHGLALVHVEENNAKGGSLRGYVQHMAVAEPDVTIQDFMQMESWQDHGRWAQSLTRIQADIKEAIAKSEGETWVGYGAAVGSTLQLYHFGLGDKLTALVDVNQGKIGRLSPGYHLPVIEPSDLAVLNPDKIVILAWRYAGMIQQQHPEYAGKWLIPLPQAVCV